MPSLFSSFKVNLFGLVRMGLQVEVYAFDIPKGCVMAYYPEANVLTGTQVDPRSKTPAFKSVRVQVTTA